MYIYSIVVILDCVHLYVENYKLIKHKSKLTSIYIYIFFLIFVQTRLKKINNDACMEKKIACHLTKVRQFIMLHIIKLPKY